MWWGCSLTLERETAPQQSNGTLFEASQKEVTRAAWRAEESVPEDMTFAGPWRTFPGTVCVCVGGGAQGCCQHREQTGPKSRVMKGKSRNQEHPGMGHSGAVT